MDTLRKDWLTPVDLLEEFGITIKIQNRLRSEKKIPYSKVGRQVRYSRERINQWLESHVIC